MAKIICVGCDFVQEITEVSHSSAVTWQELIAEKGWRQVGGNYLCPKHSASQHLKIARQDHAEVVIGRMHHIREDEYLFVEDVKW